jgi:hypothetical protein
VTDDGLADTPKSRGATTSVTAALCVLAPLVPATVSGYDPDAALAKVWIVSCEAPARVTTVGVNVAEPAEAGRPGSARVTLPWSR